MNLDGNRLSGCISDLLRDFVSELYINIPVCAPANHPGDTDALIALHNSWGKPDLENWLSRESIGEWQGVSIGANGRVVALILGDAGLSGEIPPELGGLSKLEDLLLSGNQLSGEIPPELGSLSNLRGLSLGGNQLSGEIPPELGGLSNLGWLYLSNNQLSGCIPSGLEDVPNNDFSDTGLPFCG